MRGRPGAWARAGKLLPYGFVAILYLLLSFEVRTRVPSGDWPFFMQVLHQTLHGDPFTIYANRAFGYHTFAYGPVSLYLMAPFQLFSEAVGASAEIERWLVWLPFYFADLLAALLICLVVRRGPLASRGMLLFIFSFYLLSWPVFFASPVHSHFESLILVFLLPGLAATERRRYLLGGLLSGLALLTKQSALIVVLPHVLILWRAAGLRAAVVYCATVAATVLAVMGPYLIADSANVWYMAVTLPEKLPVAHESVLNLWKTLPGVFTFLEAHTNSVIMSLALLSGAAALLRRRIALGGAHAYALYALAALIMLGFEKWNSLHYFVVPFALLVLWESLAGRWPYAGLILASAITIMFVLSADLATRISFSFLIASLALLLLGLGVYVSAYLFGPAPEQEQDQGFVITRTHAEGRIEGRQTTDDRRQ